MPVRHPWVQSEIYAARLTSYVTELYAFGKVELLVSGETLIGRGPIPLLGTIKRHSRLLGVDYNVRDVSRIVNALRQESLHPCRIDIGLLTSQWAMLKRPPDVAAFLHQTLGRRFLTRYPRKQPTLAIVLHGFGRVARILTRILSRYGPAGQIRLGAVIVRPDRHETRESLLFRRYRLLQNDSIYGAFRGDIEFLPEVESLIVNGNAVRFIAAERPEQVQLPALDAEHVLFLDTTGRQRDYRELFGRLRAGGVSALGATFPVPELPAILYGVNHFDLHELDPPVFSAGSDPANAVAPVLRLLHEEYNIDGGHLEIVRPFTNDQNLLDNIHTSPRLGRSAPENLVPFEADLIAEIERLLPGLARRLTAGYVRAPIENGALAILQLRLRRAPTRDELNRFLRYGALKSDLRDQLDFSLAPDFVSADIRANPHAAVVDSPRTMVAGKQVVVYLWFDNEYGYAAQILRLCQELSNLSIMQYA